MAKLELWGLKPLQLLSGTVQCERVMGSIWMLMLHGGELAQIETVNEKAGTNRFFFFLSHGQS